MSVNEGILDAIEIIANSAVAKASYDKTIQAQIISCQNELTGKYKCRHQDSYFYAFAANNDIQYSQNTYVYVLVPGNNMSNIKTIIGSASQLGIDYINATEVDQPYDIIGKNCIQTNSDNEPVYYLDTNNKVYSYEIYKYGRDFNHVQIDEEELKIYLRESANLIAGACFETRIDGLRQFRGHYGIQYNLRFKDTTTEQNRYLIRSYIIEQDNMKGNPYLLSTPTRQVQVFDIDGQNFDRVESIIIFNNNFPQAEGQITDQLLENGDIIITELELQGTERKSLEDLSGVALSFLTLQGTIFKEDSIPTDVKTITAQIKVKGKVLTSLDDNIKFYWGREDVGVVANSSGYNQYLGRGWKCLNQFNVITEATETEEQVIQWVSGSDSYNVSFQAATARHNKFKVAVRYSDDIILTKEIDIQNLSDNVHQISIVADNNITDFYYDIGHPTITCLTDGQEQNNYHYYWGVEDNLGVFTALSETTDDNTVFHLLQDQINTLKHEIEIGEKFENAQKQNLDYLTGLISGYDFIQRIENNKIHDIQIKNIARYSTFKCSVYNDSDIYLGTASIVLRNFSEGNGENYSLVINDGAVIFKYNEQGVAPNSNSLEIKQQIKALTFTLFDDYGNPVDQIALKNPENCYIRWMIPKNQSLIENSLENGEPTEEDDDYYYYDNVHTLNYDLTQRYNISQLDNQIKLFVNYHGLILFAETQFTFTKEGQSGTNGSEYTVKLIPNTKMTLPPDFPMITKIKNGNCLLNYGLGSAATETQIGVNDPRKMLRAQLWRSGQLIWEGFSANDPTKDGKMVLESVEWEILKNYYGYNLEDLSDFEITDSENGFIQFLGDHLEQQIYFPRANIIKCTIVYNDKVYYGTIPFITAWVLSDKYRMSLQKNSGFKYVTYASNGVLPQYNEASPFEFLCYENIHNDQSDEDFWQNISLIEGEHSVQYYSDCCGNTISSKIGQYIESQQLIPLNEQYYRQDLNDNQFRYAPVEFYTGDCVNNSIICQAYQNDILISSISVPIHFLLDRFSFPNINGWDGNSVQINDQGGYILAPQMGAGNKDANNSFTGIVMGQVKQPEKMNSETGLFGYSHGTRSFFLDSQTGAAIFGKPSRYGQIGIDPASSKALIYSGNFWKNFQDNGLPYSYSEWNQSGDGMLIDLTQPAIRWGNGNVLIDEDGFFSFGDENNHIVFNDVDGLKIKAAQVDIRGTAVASEEYVDELISAQTDFYYGVYRTGTSTSSFTPTASQIALTQEDFLFITTTKQTYIYKNNAWQIFGDDEDVKEGDYLYDSYVDGNIYRWSKVNNIYQWVKFSSYHAAIDDSIGVNLHFEGTGTLPGLMLANMRDPNVTYTNTSIDEPNVLLTANGQTSAILLRDGTTQLTKISSAEIILGNSKDQNAYYNKITSSSMEFRNKTYTLAKYSSDGIYLYKPGTTTAAVSITNSGGASFTGKIVATSGTIGSGNNLIQIGAGNIHYGVTSTGDTDHDGFYLGYNGLTIGKGKFKVSQSGVLTATGATIGGIINATSGSIGDITLGSGVIRYKRTSFSETTNDGFYLGTSGLSLGKGVFKVTNAGALTATGATITGKINATSGTIGSGDNKITIGGGNIHYGIESAGATTGTGFYLGYNGLNLGGGKFKVTSAGVLTATDATIKGAIEATSGSFKGKVEATSGTFTGTIQSKNGYIGNWDIDSSGLIYEKSGYQCIITPSLIRARKIFALSYEGAQPQCGVDGDQGSLYLFSHLDSSGSNRYNGIYYNSPPDAATDGSRTVFRLDEYDTTFYGTVRAVSDLKVKSIIKDFNWKVDQFINGLSPIAYYLKQSDSDRGKRIHLGFGAQDIAELAKSLNIGDLSMYAAMIKGDSNSENDYYEKHYDGSPIEDEKLIWGLDYSQLIAPIILQLQKLMKRVTELENQLKEIKGEK